MRVLVVVAAVAMLTACSNAPDSSPTQVESAQFPTVEGGIYLAKAIPAPVPDHYFAMSSEADLGLDPNREGGVYTSSPYDIVSANVGNETGALFFAVSRDDADFRAKADQSEPIAPADLPEVMASSPLFKDGGDGVFVVVSRYTSEEVESALDELTQHFQNVGASVAFSYAAESDAIELTGQLSEEDLDALPDTGVEYFFIPGYVGF